jgi:hypothetical protein
MISIRFVAMHGMACRIVGMVAFMLVLWTLVPRHPKTG